MNWKLKDVQAASDSAQKGSLSFSGGGKVSASVASIVGSSKVQRQVAAVKEIAASVRSQKQK